MTSSVPEIEAAAETAAVAETAAAIGTVIQTGAAVGTVIESVAAIVLYELAVPSSDQTLAQTVFRFVLLSAQYLSGFLI